MDLSVKYLGKRLKVPLVASPSPMMEDISVVRRMEDAGIGAVVLHSLFEEQIQLEGEFLDKSLDMGSELYAEALTYFPEAPNYRLGPDSYLEHIRRLKEAVDIPVIASLNGVSSGGWIEYGKLIEQAGADALELNIYFVATDLDRTSSEVERDYLDLVRDVKQSVGIPVAVKLAPWFSAMANMAKRLDDTGADALVLFNRFYQPDFDLDELEVTPTLALSSPYEVLLRLHWVAILYGRIRADLAVTGGVHGATEVLKCMMTGANVAMVTSALLRNGIGRITEILNETRTWMEEREYESIEQMRGSLSQRAVADPAAFERGNYLKVLSAYAWDRD